MGSRGTCLGRQRRHRRPGWSCGSGAAWHRAGEGLLVGAGGSAEPDESLPQTAAREAFEETGLIVEVGRELWAVEMQLGEGRVYEVHDFAATVTGGTLTAGDDAADVRWFTPTELDDVPLTHDLRGYLERAGIIPAV